MARDHRYIVFTPLAVFLLFLIAQSILQIYSSLATQKSTRPRVEARSRYDPRSRKPFDSAVWQALIESQARSSNREFRHAGSLTWDTYVNDVVGEEDREEWVAKLTKSEDPDKEANRLRNSPYIYHEKEEMKRLSSPVVQTDTKFISFYHPFDKTKKSFKLCRYNRCEYAEDFSKAHVIAFKAAFIRDHGIPAFYRPPFQRWVMFTSDPASKDYALNRPELNYKFNATCTYRLNSDISWIFGRLKKIDPPLYDYDKIYEAKEGVAAWFVSHCQTVSRREDYVYRMQNVANVKIFGLCNNVTCGNYNYQYDETTPCLPLLSQKYKFYLAFENSFCEEYVTEKFFKLFHNVHVIPVVRGGADYKKYFPSGTFINAEDFKSPEELARYLVYVGNDKKRYVQMLRKKARWTVIPAGESKHCKLCEYAHTSTTPNVYPNLKEVFNGDYPHCWQPKDIGPELNDMH